MECALSLRTIIPVEQGGTWAFHPQVPSLLVSKVNLIALHRSAGGSVADIRRPIGEENVQHFRGSQPVEDVSPKLSREFRTDLGRQGFTRGGAQSERRWLIGGG